jgi:hypothetical protein
MPWQRLRTIVEEAAAHEAADLFSKQFPRFNQAWEGLKWLLARHPTVGYKNNVNGTTYYLHVVAGDELAGTPQIAVVYTFDENQVVIYDTSAKAVVPEDT